MMSANGLAQQEDYNANKKPSYRRDSAGRRSLRRSGSFKVTDFGTNRKPACDFLLLMNTSWHTISHRFQVIEDYSSNLRLRRVGNLLFLNTLVRGRPLYSKSRNLASRNQKHRAVQNTSRYLALFRRAFITRMSDGRTD